MLYSKSHKIRCLQILVKLLAVAIVALAATDIAHMHYCWMALPMTFASAAAVAGVAAVAVTTTYSLFATHPMCFPLFICLMSNDDNDSVGQCKTLDTRLSN